MTTTDRPRRALSLAAMLSLALALAGCGALGLGGRADEARKAWGELVVHYKARAAVAEELAKAGATVPEAAEHAARLRSAVEKLAAMPAREDLVHEQDAFSAHQTLQDELARAAGMVLKTAAGTPAVEAVRGPWSKLEGDIGLARNRYVLNVREYNRERQSFFGKMMASARGFGPLANFTLRSAPGDFVPPPGKSG